MTDAGDGFPQYRVLTDFEDVIDVLGGVVAVSRLTTRSASAVCNWRNDGARFPASMFPRMQEALMKKRFLASRHLFTFLPTEGEDVQIPLVDVA